MAPLSVLDLAFVPEGATAADALARSLDLARMPSASATAASGSPSITT
jgi:hypothetical protein